eukprot:gene20825-biopygen1063
MIPAAGSPGEQERGYPPPGTHICQGGSRCTWEDPDTRDPVTSGSPGTSGKNSAAWSPGATWLGPRAMESGAMGSFSQKSCSDFRYEVVSKMAGFGYHLGAVAFLDAQMATFGDPVSAAAVLSYDRARVRHAPRPLWHAMVWQLTCERPFACIVFCGMRGCPIGGGQPRMPQTPLRRRHGGGRECATGVAALQGYIHVGEVVALHAPLLLPQRRQLPVARFASLVHRCSPFWPGGPIYNGMAVCGRRPDLKGGSLQQYLRSSRGPFWNFRWCRRTMDQNRYCPARFASETMGARCLPRPFACTRPQLMTVAHTCRTRSGGRVQRTAPFRERMRPCQLEGHPIHMYAEGLFPLRAAAAAAIAAAPSPLLWFHLPCLLLRLHFLPPPPTHMHTLPQSRPPAPKFCEGEGQRVGGDTTLRDLSPQTPWGQGKFIVPQYLPETHPTTQQ